MQQTLSTPSQSNREQPVPPWVGLLKAGREADAAGRAHDALISLEEAALIAPDEPAVLRPLARLLAQTGRSEEAVAMLRDATNRQPATLALRVALARALAINGDHDQALAEARSSFTLGGGPSAELELAHLELMRGDFQNGLEHWEARFRLPHSRDMFANIDQPPWDGSPLGDRKLLVIGDQGYGDVLQFCRFATGIEGQESCVLLGLSPPLRRLLSCLGLPIVGSVEQAPGFDIWAPMSSLPRLLGTTPETIPACGGYLALPEAAIARWKSRFADLAQGRPLVGLTWSGRPTFAENGLRSLDRAARDRLLSLPEAALVSLQKEGAGDELPPGVIDIAPDLNDFQDTAAALGALDLLVTTDTAVAHLAGALGRPAWLLLSTANDWRWGPAGQTVPWYDSLRAFRQSRSGDWRPVLDAVWNAFDSFRKGFAGSTPVPSTRMKTRPDLDPLPQSGTDPAPSAGKSAAAKLYRAARAHHKAGRLRPAAFHLEQIWRRGELNASGKAFLADIYRMQERYAAAISMARRALDMAPNDVLATRTMGLALYSQKRFDEALTVLRRALEIDPEAQGLRADIANVLLDTNQDDAAIEILRAECERLPGKARPLSNLGTGLRWVGRDDEAETVYRQALEIEPDNDDVKLGLSLILIARTKRWAEGWKLYEGRWTSQDRPRIKSSAPEWHGEDVRGKRLIVTPEQGLGDNIQMLRFVPQLIERGAKVILCQPVSLLDVIPDWHLEALVSPADPMPKADFQCPIMSLPLHLGTTIETLPTQIPYIASAQDSLNRWRAVLSDLGDPRIGIVWSGNAKQRLNARRSIPFEMLRPLLSTPGCTFVSLQVGPNAADLKTLDDSRIIDLGDELGTMGDTAAAMGNLDLVISVCTSVVHIAGALGRPTWLLRSSPPDWRWAEGGDRTIWYPTVRQFAQGPERSWPTVIERVRAELETCLTKKPMDFLPERLGHAAE